MDVLAILVLLMAAVMVVCMFIVSGEIELIKTKMAGFEQIGIKKRSTSTKPPFAPPPKPGIFREGYQPICTNKNEIDNPPTGRGSKEIKYTDMMREFLDPPIMPICFENEELTFGRLDKNKIYYLCHPATSGGRSLAENKRREEYLYQRIISQNTGAKIIRPLALIPDDMEYQEAMKRCYSFIDASHAIILPLGWQKSTGCSLEHKYSEHAEKERIFIAIA